MSMNQVEVLLRLSQNAQDKGDEMSKRHRAEREAHTSELLELERMNTLAGQNIAAELARWGVKPAPEQGQLPAGRPPQQRIANGGTHGEQARAGKNPAGDGRIQAGHVAQ